MRPITAEWVAKAEADFAVMERESRVRKNPSYDAVCFHAQQCAEKYLKARLVEAGMAFAKIHDLIALLEQVSQVEPAWALFRPDLSLLSDFAVEVRYPGEPVQKETVREAVRSCRRFRAAARMALGLPAE